MTVRAATTKLNTEHMWLAIDAATVSMWCWNVDTDKFTMDECGHIIWGLPNTNGPLDFEALSAQIHPSDRNRVRAAFVATRSVTGPYEIDFRIIIEGELRWVSARGKGGDEGIINREMFGIFIDVTGRKQAEEGNELLAGEMSHRVKNLLAIATGLTQLTARSAKTVESMARDLTKRLTALGRAHDLIRPLPSSQGSAALLGDLFAVLLSPYDDLGAFNGRVRVAVPRMGVGERSATGFAMVVHELATNSLKHGALSSDVGMIEITGALQEDMLELTWSETGGPAINAVPQLNGFGNRMIAQILNDELGGSIAYDWQPRGLVAIFTAKVVHLPN